MVKLDMGVLILGRQDREINTTEIKMPTKR